MKKCVSVYPSDPGTRGYELLEFFLINLIIQINVNNIVINKLNDFIIHTLCKRVKPGRIIE